MSWRLLTKDRKVINLRFIWEQIIKKRIIPKIENGLEMDWLSKKQELNWFSNDHLPVGKLQS